MKPSKYMYSSLIQQVLKEWEKILVYNFIKALEHIWPQHELEYKFTMYSAPEKNQALNYHLDMVHFL